MKRLKSDDETLDRLSELSDSLILKILSFLEMRDVVRTSLVSKRWKDLWTTISYLDFDESGKNSVQTRNFINGVLLRWKGTKILRFKIRFGKVYDASLSGDVDFWVGFATERKVEELYLRLPYDYRKPDPLEILDALLSGSRQKLSIRSSSLKKLTLATVLALDTLLSYGDEYDPSNYTSITIWAPNLEALAISGAPCSTCLLLNVPSLTSVTLDFHDICDVRVGETLKQLLPAIQHVEALTLSLCCSKMLGLMKAKYSFSNVKILKFIGGPIEPTILLVLFDFFPRWRSYSLIRNVMHGIACLLQTYHRSMILERTT